MKVNDILSLALTLALLIPGFCSHAQTKDSSIFAKPLNLDASVKTERIARSEQKGDTLIFNAAAYQVAENADSERLVSKMPGISVSDSGVEANGKEIARVLVDGQEFFGSDVMSALRNIPADMVKQIEVINRLSDAARLTGVDDGNGHLALNVVTKRKKGTGMTSGRVYGSYGISDKAEHRHNYIVGGNLTNFTDQRTISIIGMSNNISKFNFSSSDIVSGCTGMDARSNNTFNIKALSGISTVHSLGLNYTSKKLNLTYFFTDITNSNLPVSYKITKTTTEGKELSTHIANDYWAHNMTHKLTGKITLTPSDRHSFIINPSVTFEDLANGKDQLGRYSYLYSDRPESFVRIQRNLGDNDRWAIRAASDINYRYKFAKKRRSMSLYGKYLFYKNSAFDRSWEYRWDHEDADTSNFESINYSYIQNKDRANIQHQVTGKFTYSEPLTRHSIISAELNYYMTSTDGENLVFPCTDGVYTTTPKERVSAINTSTFHHNRAGLRYNYWFRKISITAIATYQNTIYNGTTRLPAIGSNHKVYHHPLYVLIANIPFNKDNTLRIEARGRTQNPGNHMLQGIVDRSSTSNVRAGNPDINPAYLHTAEIRYVNTNKKAGTTFSFSSTYTGSQNYFCDSLIIDQPDFIVDIDDNGKPIRLGNGNQFVKPINLGGYHKFLTKTSLSMPIDFMRCNLNIGAQASIQRLPGMINGEYVPIKRDSYQVSGRLDSNISKNIDFTIGYTASYNMNQYSGKFGMVENNFITQRASARIKWIFLRNFTFTGGFIYKNYKSTQGLYNDNIYLCDLFIGHRFLKSRKLEVSIGVNDLFDNNVRQFWHSVTASGRTDGANLGIGRYFSAQIIWHFRTGK